MKSDNESRVVSLKTFLCNLTGSIKTLKFNISLRTDLKGEFFENEYKF